MSLPQPKRPLLICLVGIAVIPLAILAIAFTINHSSNKAIESQAADLSPAEVAIVLGARVNNGVPTPMLEDRALRAVELYKAGKVEKILVSADHGSKNYDEVNPMRRFLLQRGVRPADLFLDHAGFDTYDSMYRARNVFKVHSAIVVTQRFHLPRAVYVAKQVGLKASGFVADRQDYGGTRMNEIREIPAKAKAFIDVQRATKPKFLGPAIPISGDGRKSWDTL